MKSRPHNWSAVVTAEGQKFERDVGWGKHRLFILFDEKIGQVMNTDTIVPPIIPTLNIFS